MKQEHKKYELVIGRWQCIPPHDGHLALIKKLLSEDKNVAIGLRKQDGTDKNPYTQKQRKRVFKKIFKQEIKEGKVVVFNLVDINNIVYGREVGWGIREIKLDAKTEAISATKIRKELKK